MVSSMVVPRFTRHIATTWRNVGGFGRILNSGNSAIYFSSKSSTRRNNSSTSNSVDGTGGRRVSQGTTWRAPGPVNSRSSTIIKLHTGTRRPLNFSNSEKAFASKTTLELIRGLFIFKLCSINFVVDNNKKLMDIGRRVLGSFLFGKLMRASFYGHFVGGENEGSLKPLMDRMHKHGVGSILDYSVEEDLTKEYVKQQTMRTYSGESVEGVVSDRDVQYRPDERFADLREDVHSARTYVYQDEAKCDDNTNIFLHCIDVAGATSKNGFAAVKLTALGRPQFLMQLSEVLVQIRRFYDKIAGTDGHVLKRKLDKDSFHNNLQRIGVRMDAADSGKYFTLMDNDSSGDIDLLDWNTLMNPDTDMSSLFKIPNPETGELEPIITSLTDEESQQMRNMIHRIDILAKRANEKGVKLMIDAEQTYFQPAISRLALELMKIYNKEHPVIFNTYQCYLKEAYNNIFLDVESARRHGFKFGAKVVRGAYMEQERRRALELGYTDPVCGGYEDTSVMFNRCIDRLLRHITTTGGVHIMVASHNEDSVRRTVDRMDEFDIPVNGGGVYFGQLLGMCDQVTFSLGRAGYQVYKYVPFGPVEEVLPYLSRRAYENRGMLIGAVKEKRMLLTEIKRRVTRAITLRN